MSEKGSNLTKIKALRPDKPFPSKILMTVAMQKEEAKNAEEEKENLKETIELPPFHLV